ncbi:MAG TPA: succinate dehydrogenase, partial [Azospirillaceae bacterium]|nr:succinate dehydrogenase [Azospirillaceae bacterium]
MTARLELWLWIAARLTAFVLAFGVLIHLITVIYAVRGGLSATEILARTQGNVAWLIFYVLFAWSVAIHAGIGTRTIVGEWT